MFRLILTASLTAVLMLTASHAFAMTIFVSNEKDNTITVLDGDTLEIKKTIKVARRPRGIVLSPDFKELFVAAGDGDIMDVIDTQTLEVKRQLESGPDPELMAVDPKGEVIYIANEDDSLVTIMDIKTGEVLAEVPVGVEPEGMTVSPDGKYTVATSESTSMAHVIDSDVGDELAQVQRELSDARHLQAASAAVLRVISQSSGDVQPVFAIQRHRKRKVELAQRRDPQQVDVAQQARAPADLDVGPNHAVGTDLDPGARRCRVVNQLGVKQASHWTKVPHRGAEVASA